jgi:hypothetical protein
VLFPPTAPRTRSPGELAAGSSPPPRPRRPERCRTRSCTWYPGRGPGTGTTRRLFRVDHEVTGAWVTHAPLGCRVTPRTRPRRVDTSMQKNTYTWRSRSPGLGHQPDRPVRCRSGDRRHRDRRRAPGVPVRGQGPLRLLERHRPRRGVLRGSQEGLPAVAARQPAGQSRHPRGCDQPDPAPAQRRPCLL